MMDPCSSLLSQCFATIMTCLKEPILEGKPARGYGASRLKMRWAPLAWPPVRQEDGSGGTCIEGSHPVLGSTEKYRQTEQDPRSFYIRSSYRNHLPWHTPQCLRSSHEVHLLDTTLGLSVHPLVSLIYAFGSQMSA